MAKEDQYLEIILQTNEWFDNKKTQLQLLIDSKNDLKFLFEFNGKKIPLPKEHEKGFFLGIETAITVLGEFPIKITRDNESN